MGLACVSAELCTYVQENAAAFFVELSAEDRKYLEEIFAPACTVYTFDNML